LEPLPYPDADRLVNVWRTNPERGFREFPQSVPNFLDFQAADQVFAHVSAYTSVSQTLDIDGDPQVVECALVSAEFCSTLGVPLSLGRGFESGEDQTGAAPVAVISDALWRSRFGGDPGAIGETLRLDGKSHQIIGVLPPGREFPSTAQVWTAITLDPRTSGRGSNFLSVVGRLKPRVTIEQAAAQWNATAEQLEQQHPQFNAGSRIELVPLQEQLVGRVKQPLLILFGAVALVLLIACANVANLMLARANIRQRELAVRAALGASRGRLVRQLLTESLLLSIAGATTGLLLASWTRDLLIGLNPFGISRLYDSAIDFRVLGFAAGVAVLTGIVFGLLPALHVTALDLSAAIREGGGPSYSGSLRRRLRNTMVVVEVALSLVLLIGAGLLIRSFLSLRAHNPGFDPGGVMTLNVSLPGQSYGEPARRVEFIRRVTEGLATIPGADAVASAAYVPMAEMRTTRRFAFAGQPLPEPGKEPIALEIPVGPGYFALLGIPIRSGRDFTSTDSPNTPVLIVNESFAQQHFPGEEAVGKQIRFYSSSPQAPPPPPVEIIGVVGNVSQMRPESGAEPTIYASQLLRPWSFMSFMVKSNRDPALIANAARAVISAADKSLAVSSVAPLEEVVSRRFSHRRGLMALVGVFAAVSLLLAMVGIYGVLSYLVSQRSHEIGVRMAIGARRADVLRLVVGQGMKLALAGVALGLAGGAALNTLLGSILYGIGPRDPLTFFGVALLLLGVALIACYLPARRATRVDPMNVLRQQ
jgi:putative ABC transport system permease protein